MRRDFVSPVSLARIAATCALSCVAGCAMSPGPSGSSTPTRQVIVALTQGTNMAAAASPDGRTLILGIQGSLWTLPVGGGEATRITGPEVEATSPSWSPDGTRIAFQNYDASG